MSASTDSYFAHETAIIEKPSKIGKGTRIWHFSHIMPESDIGSDCNLGQNVFIDKNVIIGNKVKVQNNVSLYNGVICEDEVFLGPSVVFTNVINPRSAIERQDEFKKTIVKKGATIGANATIVCGIEIGNYAFIGAGAVVINDIPSYALVVGNPARQIGWMSEYGHRLKFNKENLAQCPESKDKYLLKNNHIIKKLYV